MTQDSLTRTVKDTASAAKEDLAQVADKAKSAIRAEAEARAELGKDIVSDQGMKLADSLRSDADDLQARMQNVLAQGVADLSEELRQTNLTTILEGTQDFARRHPGAFVAGAALAGFALARFLRASEPARPAAITHGNTLG
ncbi:MAG: hypothetical protein KDK24_01490 [Pseudooceanicola sp.]|nr:hypothetical protein [Pseudooceanicola sp.]